MNRLVYRLTEALTVSKCPSCGALTKRSGTLCPDCLEKYEDEKRKECEFCKMPASVCVCSTRGLYYCRQLGTTMRSAVFYGSGNEVFMSALKSLKYSSDRGAEKFFARELSGELLKLFAEKGEMPEDWCVTYPPRRRAAVRKYGVDQSKGIAKRIAAYTGMRFEKTLVRTGGAAQKTLGKEMRKENAGHSFKPRKKASVYGKKYVIVDDVITSGETMKACQTILLSGGASAAFALSVAKTPLRGAGYDTRIRFRKKKQSDLWFKNK